LGGVFTKSSPVEMEREESGVEREESGEESLW